jgi:sugar phosphate isomerase/epimerase
MGNVDILSIQLYTLRSLGELDRVLDTVKQAGYGHLETVGSHLDDAENVRNKLDARGLKVSSSHVSLAALRERPDVLVRACRTLGFDQLFIPAVPPAQRQSDAPFWRALGRELGEMAERMRDQEIALGYHNHDWELAPKDGPKTALELIFEAAAGSPLAWQVDIAWLVRGGADPKEWMQRYRDRVVSAHVKDIAPARA